MCVRALGGEGDDDYTASTIDCELASPLAHSHERLARNILRLITVTL